MVLLGAAALDPASPSYAPPVALPDFRLEVYLGRWEFAAKHHLTASDAQTLTVAEALGPDGL